MLRKSGLTWLLGSGRNYFSVLNNSSQFDTGVEAWLGKCGQQSRFWSIETAQKITPALLRPADYGGHYTLFCGCKVKCILASPRQGMRSFLSSIFICCFQGSHETNEDHERQRHLAEIVWWRSTFNVCSMMTMISNSACAALNCVLLRSVETPHTARTNYVV